MESILNVVAALVGIAGGLMVAGAIFGGIGEFFHEHEDASIILFLLALPLLIFMGIIYAFRDTEDKTYGKMFIIGLLLVGLMALLNEVL